MIGRKRAAVSPRPARFGDLVAIQSAQYVAFPSSNPLRNADCLICRRPIGLAPVAIVGVAALVGEPCDCGGIPADVFMLHASHAPLDPTELQVAISRALSCPINHNAP